MKHRNLDEEYPMGDPEARECRECGRFKRLVRGARGCAICDAVDKWPNSASPA